jgi:hypothetical protein
MKFIATVCLYLINNIESIFVEFLAASGEAVRLISAPLNLTLSTF